LAGATASSRGPVLDYLNSPKLKMCCLYLSRLDRDGVHFDGFGDSKERLSEVCRHAPRHAFSLHVFLPQHVRSDRCIVPAGTRLGFTVDY
jgi:hypothetical protein